MQHTGRPRRNQARRKKCPAAWRCVADGQRGCRAENGIPVFFFFRRGLRGRPSLALAGKREDNPPGDVRGVVADSLDIFGDEEIVEDCLAVVRLPDALHQILLVDDPPKIAGRYTCTLL